MTNVRSITHELTVKKLEMTVVELWDLLASKFGEYDGYMRLHMLVCDIWGGHPYERLISGARELKGLITVIEFNPPNEVKVNHTSKEADLKYTLTTLEGAVKHFDRLMKLEEDPMRMPTLVYLQEFQREDWFLEYGLTQEFLDDQAEAKECPYYKDLKLVFIKSRPEQSITNFDPYADSRVNRLIGREMAYKIGKVLITEYLIKNKV